MSPTFICLFEGMMLWYLEKVETDLSQETSNPREGILTLYSLLESPPGDFPEDLREGIISGFIGIFSSLRFGYCSFLLYFVVLFKIIL